MTVKQTGDRIEIETTISGDQGDQVVKDAYVLDGKETDFSQKMGGAAAKGKRTSSWAGDGNCIRGTESAPIAGEMGEADIKATRKWTLSADAKTLTIVLNVEGPMGAQTVKRVFVKG